MMEFVRDLLAHADAFRWIFMLALLFAFYRWMQSDNGIEWRDFVSAEKPNGQYRGDINRLGQSVGVCVAAFAIISTAPKAHTDFAGFALVLGACLAFLGGVAAYAAKLRADSSKVETVTTTEPAPSTPLKTTVTTTEPAPAAPLAEEPVPPSAAPAKEPVPVQLVAGPGTPGEKPLTVKETP